MALRKLMSEVKKGTEADGVTNVGGWVASIVVWAAAIALVLAIAAALLGTAE
jgi:hypothetical protein